MAYVTSIDNIYCAALDDPTEGLNAITLCITSQGEVDAWWTKRNEEGEVWTSGVKTMNFSLE